MEWYGWVILGLLALSSMLNVLHVGRPRKPINPGDLVAILTINFLMGFGILQLGGVI